MQLGEGQFIIDRILDRRIKEGRVEYYVKWRGYPLEQSTWEPLHNLKGVLKYLLRFESTAKGTFEKRRKRRAEASAKLGRPKGVGEDQYFDKWETKRLGLMADDIETILIDSDCQREEKEMGLEQIGVGEEEREMNFAAQIEVSHEGAQKILMSFQSEEKREKQIPPQPTLAHNPPPPYQPFTSQPSPQLYIARFRDGREVTMTKEQLLAKHPRKFSQLTKNQLHGKRERP